MGLAWEALAALGLAPVAETACLRSFGTLLRALVAQLGLGGSARPIGSSKVLGNQGADRL